MDLGEPMRKPVFDLWKININTLLILASIAGYAFWAGRQYSDVLSSVNDNTKEIATIKATIASLPDVTSAIKRNADAVVHVQTDVASLETSRAADEQDIAGLKYRVGTLENGATATASTLHDQEKSINQIASDVRATRLLVECLAKRDCAAGPERP